MSNKICTSADSGANHQSVDKVFDLTKRRKHQELDMEIRNASLRVSSDDPGLWKRSDVASWLRWAVEFYQLDIVDPSKFGMNGRGLCLLTRNGFMSRAPSCGDVLHSDFQGRYGMAVLKAEKEKKKRKAPWQPDAKNSVDDTKRPRDAEKQ